MRYLSVFSFCLVTACATAPSPPQIVNITLSSIQPGLADETIIGSGDYSETYKVPGYLINFNSSHKIQDSRFNNSSFFGVDYFQCSESKLKQNESSSSTRNYKLINYGANVTKYIMQLDRHSYRYQSDISQSAVDSALRFSENSKICMSIFISHEKQFENVTHAKVISNHLLLDFPKK